MNYELVRQEYVVNDNSFVYEDVAKMTNFNILGVEIELRGYYNNVSTRKK